MTADGQTAAVPTSGRPIPHWLAWFVALGVVVGSLGLRLQRLDAFVTPDEMKWVCRSVNFYRALSSGDFASTLQTGHPGVITMWLGVPWSGVDITNPWLDACQNPSLSDIIEESPPSVPEELAGYLFGARRGVALFTSLALALSMWLLSLLAGWRVALVCGALVALDPFYLAHSRLLHLDAIVTSLLFPAVLAVVIGLERAKRGFLVLGGALLALAALNKSPAAFGMGFAGIITLAFGWRRGWTWRRCLGAVVTWALPAILVYWATWPALWVAPARTVGQVLSTALFYASRPHVNSNYFMGVPRPDPGWGFYGVALAFRLTPWAAIASAVGLSFWAARGRRAVWPGAMALFIVLYAAFMTAGQKKFDRYLLPVFPFVQALAAYGFVRLADAVPRLRTSAVRTWLGAIGPMGAVVAMGVTAVNEAPYYLTYYSPLAGGKAAAARVLLVGWGEGLDQAAHYLNSLPDAAERAVASRALPGFAPFYTGPVHHQSSYDPATTDYVVFYINEVQRRLEPDLMADYYDSAVPLHVVRVKGIDYVWIYQNRTHERVLAELKADAAPGDAIVVSRPSILQREYSGGLPVYTLQLAASRQDTIATLQQAASHGGRVWYVAYPEKDPSARLELVSFLLSTHARRLRAADLGPVSVSLWDPDERTAFDAAPSPREDVSRAFAGELVLRGYSLQDGEADPSRFQGITLEWEVIAAPTRYYACYVHVVDEGGRILGQGDHWMRDGSLRPTVDWRPGDVVYEDVALELSPGMAPGRYALVLGVHDRSLGQAASAALPQDGPAETAELGTLRVGETTGKHALPEGMRRLDPPLEPAPGLAMVGYSMSTFAPAFGEPLVATLVWESTEALSVAYALRLEVVSGAGSILATADFPLSSDADPATRWTPEVRRWRHYALSISRDAEYGPATLRATAVDGRSVVGTPVPIVALDVQGHRFSAPAVANRQEASIGDAVRLLGYDLQGERLSPGGTLDLTLHWWATNRTAVPLTVFAHLLDPSGAVRAQHDGAPMDAQYPTNEWRPGEYVVDRHTLRLASDAPAGEYRLEVGMYDAAGGGARLPLFDGSGVRQPDDRLLLSLPVHVGP